MDVAPPKDSGEATRVMQHRITYPVKDNDVRTAMALRRLILVPLVATALSLTLHAQVKPSEAKTKPPQLKLEVIPTKKVYKVGDTVFVKYRLTSLVDGTLCFAPPAMEQTGRAGGYLKTDATPPKGTDAEFFIDDVWPRYPTDEELRRDVANRWIKLGMSEPYTPREKGRIFFRERASGF
jgi:hypothetical protein